MSRTHERARRLSDSDIRQVDLIRSCQQNLGIPNQKPKSRSIHNLQQANSFDDGSADNNESNGARRSSRVIKIAILGDTGIGKSALTVRYITKRFITEYSPTLEATYTYQDTLDKQTVVFRIRDTAGHEVAREGNIYWADAFICMYSITDMNTFETMKQIVNIITNTRTARCPCIIVANKTDLTHFRTVSKTDGGVFAKSFQYPFREVSVAEDIKGVCEIFKTLYKQVVHSQNAKKRGSVSKKILMNKIFPKRKDNAPKKKDMLRTLDSIPQFVINAP